MIYVAHFIFGADWASYLSINYLGVGGLAAVAFAIARITLGLSASASAFAALLACVSPSVLDFSIWELGFASESLASFLAGCAFLAVVARRDFLCVLLLLVAILTKETVVWCPFTAALSVLLRPEPSRDPLRRGLAAGAMLLPIAIWLVLRVAFFEGLGGTYATTGYTPLLDFLSLTLSKLVRLHHLFTSQYPLLPSDLAGADRILRIAAGSLVLLLLALWFLRCLREVSEQLVLVARGKRWPRVEAGTLVTLWAATGLAFYFALALPDERYAASAVMFAWPAMVGATLRRRAWLPHFALAVCAILSLVRVPGLLFDRNPPEPLSPKDRFFSSAAEMNEALRQVPPEIEQIYVIPADSLGWDNPEYLRALLGVHAQIIRVAEVEWYCWDRRGFVSLDHEIADGTVTLTASLPDCARFYLSLSGIDVDGLVNGRLNRGASIAYDMPNATPPENSDTWRPMFEPPQQMTAHIRPQGHARFLIEHGAPDGGLAWFDTP